MDYISVQEAAKKWNITPRQVQKLLKEDRIEGVQRLGRTWMIPQDALKPSDLRKNRKNQWTEKTAGREPAVDGVVREHDEQGADVKYLAYGMLITSFPYDVDSKKPVDSRAFDEKMLRQYEGEIAYMQGDFERAKRCFYDADDKDEIKLCACLISMAAAISSNDYSVYNEIELFVKSVIDKNPGSENSLTAQMVMAAMYVSMFVPHLVPGWLKKGEFEDFPEESRRFLLYLYTKYLQNTGQFSAMGAAVKAAQILEKGTAGVTSFDVYLNLMGACAAIGEMKKDEAREFLEKALAAGLSAEFTTPFSECAISLVGIMEPILENQYPQWMEELNDLWEKSMRNWLIFHNYFAKANISVILSRREYVVAEMLAKGHTYAQISEHLNLSKGLTNNIVAEIYGKLYINNKYQLRNLIL